MPGVKVAIIGNMNNNAVNLARYLQDAGLDCTVLLYRNEAAHFSPEADAISGITYKVLKLSWGGYADYYLTSPKKIRSDLAGFDYIIGSRLAPAFLAKAGIPLDMFMPTGGDIHTVPFFNTWAPRDLLKWAGFSRIQREAIKKVKCLFLDDTNPKIDQMIAPFTSHLDRVKHAVPLLYYPDYQGDRLKERCSKSAMFADFMKVKASTDILLFHHVKHVWTKKMIDFYGSFHEKGNDQIVIALANYHSKRPSVEIKIAMFEYGLDYPNTKALAESLGVGDKIIWFPQMPRSELMLGIGVADLVIGEVSNSWFSYGTILEAMSMHKTVMHHRDDHLYPSKSLYPMINICNSQTIEAAFWSIASGSYDLNAMGAEAFQWLKETGFGAGIAEIVERANN